MPCLQAPAVDECPLQMNGELCLVKVSDSLTPVRITHGETYALSIRYATTKQICSSVAVSAMALQDWGKVCLNGSVTRRSANLFTFRRIGSRPNTMKELLKEMKLELAANKAHFANSRNSVLGKVRNRFAGYDKFLMGLTPDGFTYQNKHYAWNNGIKGYSFDTLKLAIKCFKCANFEEYYTNHFTTLSENRIKIKRCLTPDAEALEIETQELQARAEWESLQQLTPKLAIVEKYMYNDPRETKPATVVVQETAATQQEQFDALFGGNVEVKQVQVKKRGRKKDKLVKAVA